MSPGDLTISEAAGMVILIAVIFAGFFITSQDAMVPGTAITSQTVTNNDASFGWFIIAVGIIGALVFVIGMIKLWPSGSI
jgi:hypothetical protein